MGFWKWVFLGLLCAAFISSIDAVELHRDQPTERISGGFWIFWDHFMLFFIFLLCCVFVIIMYVSLIMICFGLRLIVIFSASYFEDPIFQLPSLLVKILWLTDRPFCCDLWIGFLFDTVPKFLSITILEGRHE